MKEEKNKQHPITYEHIAILIMVLVIVFIIGSAGLYWFQTDKSKTEIPVNENFWHCFSNDGRINYVVVKSEKMPSYLPVSGNEKVDYYCNKIEVKSPTSKNY